MMTDTSPKPVVGMDVMQKILTPSSWSSTNMYHLRVIPRTYTQDRKLTHTRLLPIPHILPSSGGKCYVGVFVKRLLVMFRFPTASEDCTLYPPTYLQTGDPTMECMIFHNFHGIPYLLRFFPHDRGG